MQDSVFNHMTSVKMSSVSLPEQAADKICHLIIDSSLEKGERLPSEFELAAQLGVGRGTIREAVKLLVARNILEIQRGKGTFIADNTGLIEDPFGFAYFEDKERLVKELFDIRIQMEPWVAGLAAECKDKDKLDKLGELMLEVEKRISAGENHLPADQQFHIAIAECAENRVLPMLTKVITYSVKLFGEMNDQKLLKETISDHRAIYEAITSGDVTGAKAAMTKHLMNNKWSVPALNR